MFKLVFGLVVVSIASAEVLYPCGQPAPLECVTAYMAVKARCHTPELPESDVYTHEAYLIEMPFSRSSIYRYENTIEGGIKDATYDLLDMTTGTRPPDGKWSAPINPFFEDPNIGNRRENGGRTDSGANLTVLTWNFAQVKVYGREELQYHAPGQVDTVVDTGYAQIVKNIQTTAQWPGVERFTIGTGKIYAFIGSTEPYPNFQEGFPELAAEIANNPNGIAARTRALRNEEREIFLREQETEVGLSFATVSRRHILCDSFET